MDKYDKLLNDQLKTIHTSLSLDTTLTDLESYYKIQERLQAEYVEKKKVSPSLAKMIEEWLTELKRSAGNNISQRNLRGLDAVCNEAYRIIIAGKNPTIYRYVRPFGEETELKINSDLKDRLVSLAKGVAFAHVIPKLEKELLALNTGEVINESQSQSIKLNWLGQKNQLYYVIRLLKEKGLLGNSYEEIALFLKTSVDQFQDTALSTITKAIGKETTLPKSRRINIDEN